MLELEVFWRKLQRLYKLTKLLKLTEIVLENLVTKEMILLMMRALRSLSANFSRDPYKTPQALNLSSWNPNPSSSNNNDDLYFDKYKFMDFVQKICIKTSETINWVIKCILNVIFSVLLEKVSFLFLLLFLFLFVLLTCWKIVFVSEINSVLFFGH